jgi:hypothetical protein
MLHLASMLVRKGFCSVLGVVALASVVGCSSSNTGSDGSGGSAANSSSAAGTSICSTDPRAEAYKVGLTETATDGAVSIKLQDANPAPPTRGNNTFHIALTDKAGKPIEGAEISTKTWMPDHGHGSSIVPTTTPSGNGVYEINPLNLFMPGIWQITFDVTEKDKTTDSVMFTFCIDG